jgi:hypothetical protein
MMPSILDEIDTISAMEDAKSQSVAQIPRYARQYAAPLIGTQSSTRAVSAKHRRQVNEPRVAPSIQRKMKNGPHLRVFDRMFATRKADPVLSRLFSIDRPNVCSDERDVISPREDPQPPYVL